MFIFKIIRKIIFLFLPLIITLAFLGFAWSAGHIYLTARTSQPVRSDVLVVMGAAQSDGKPDEILQARLQRAKSIYDKGLVKFIYTVGAGAPGDRTTEAMSSFNWLVANGVNPKSIVVIAKGKSTLESTKAYAKVMKENNLQSVIIATDPYHCLRAITMAKDLELFASCAKSISGPADLENSSYRYLLRETAAYVAYVTLGRHGIVLSDRN